MEKTGGEGKSDGDQTQDKGRGGDAGGLTEEGKEGHVEQVQAELKEKREEGHVEQVRWACR